jgi:ferredoxin-NADP reductase
MTSLSLLLWIALAIALQLGLFLAFRLWHHRQAYLQLKQGSDEPAIAADSPRHERAAWTGFRSFRITRRCTEDTNRQICSFYLVPEDGAPLPAFLPGQFLTFRLSLPTPLVRCYSLSDAPGSDHYRISVKRVPSGRSSNFFHDAIQPGATLEVRAPSGHFHLEHGDSPVVLIAGGIGITPMTSMLNWCCEHQPEREVWLFYGVRNSAELAFGDHLQDIARKNPNFHLRLCFSNPQPDELARRDFHHPGRIDINLLRMELPLKPYHYFLCGPAPMLESLVPALEAWGVPDSRIHFEAFGPASIKRSSAPRSAATAEDATTITVTFAKSGKQVEWTPQSGSLLELAEAAGIAIDSGCRAGGCGTCQTTIRSGEITCRQPPDYDPDPGSCLMCISIPKTALTLEL